MDLVKYNLFQDIFHTMLNDFKVGDLLITNTSDVFAFDTNLDKIDDLPIHSVVLVISEEHQQFSFNWSSIDVYTSLGYRCIKSYDFHRMQRLT
jgi:hypothetical protein